MEEMKVENGLVEDEGSRRVEVGFKLAQSISSTTSAFEVGLLTATRPSNM